MRDERHIDIVKEDLSEDFNLVFENGVRLCLDGKLKDNQIDIIKTFTQSFSDEFSIDFINLNLYNGGLGEASTTQSKVFLFDKIFTKEQNLIEDIGTLFHELEHINTEKKNRLKSFVYNDEYIYYVDFLSTKINRDLGYALYYLSPNELNSRKIEVDFIERFLKKVEYLIETEEKFNTKKNVDFLQKSKKILDNKKAELNKNIKKFETIKEKNKNKIKKMAKKHFETIKFYADNKIKIDDKIEFKLREASNFVINYLNTYKDKEFFDKIYNHLLE